MFSTRILESWCRIVECLRVKSRTIHRGETPDTFYQFNDYKGNDLTISFGSEFAARWNQATPTSGTMFQIGATGARFVYDLIAFTMSALWIYFFLPLGTAACKHIHQHRNTFSMQVYHQSTIYLSMYIFITSTSAFQLPYHSALHAMLWIQKGMRVQRY